MVSRPCTLNRETCPRGRDLGRSQNARSSDEVPVMGMERRERREVDEGWTGKRKRNQRKCVKTLNKLETSGADGHGWNRASGQTAC